eukprot:m.7938 g.7938  ORF g.7938 m.7938 type:complete len:410 (+) comp8971_c0_seq6:439-1668(+)
MGAGPSKLKVSEEDVAQVQKQLRAHIKNMETVKDTTLAVTGMVSSGKSTFINTDRGLRPEDEGAAATDYVQTTAEVSTYPYRGLYSPVRYQDYPGVGTPEFPQDTYLEKTGILNSDIIIIMYHNGTPKEMDLWLLFEAVRAGMKALLVHSKMDECIRHANGESIAKVKQRLQEELRGRLETYCRTHGPVPGGLTIDQVCEKAFFISGLFEHAGQFDFPQLQEAIVAALPVEKQRGLSMAQYVGSPRLIDTKARELHRTAVYYALSASVGGLIPVPGISAVAVDLPLILAFFNKAKAALHLDNDEFNDPLLEEINYAGLMAGLEPAAAMLFITPRLKRLLVTAPLAWLSAALAKGLKSTGIGIALGMAVGALVGGPVMYYVLRQLLKRMVKAAKIKAKIIYNARMEKLRR